MSLELYDAILHTIETVSIISLIFAIYEIRKGNEQRFREILANYLQMLKENYCERFKTLDEKDRSLFSKGLLMIDQCIFSILNMKNKIKKDELIEELSRMSTTLYFGELEEVKEKIQWFKTELFR
ncbi:MAG: hypothetical protein ACTSRS_14090 [Candidatus Helarchaeota archaeon]